MESPVQNHLKHDMETGIYKEHLGQGLATHTLQVSSEGFQCGFMYR